MFKTFRFMGSDDNYEYYYNPCYPTNINEVVACSDNTAAVSCYICCTEYNHSIGYFEGRNFFMIA